MLRWRYPYMRLGDVVQFPDPDPSPSVEFTVRHRIRQMCEMAGMISGDIINVPGWPDAKVPGKEMP